MLAARLKTDGGADGSANLSSDSAARDPRKPRGWARAQLAREIYWAADPVVPRPEVRSTARLSEIMREFERSLRADARAAVPKWEPTLRVGRRWRRVTKRAMFRLLRPVTRRYDRVAADLAMLEGSLAQQLERSDAEIRRLDASLAQQLERSDAEIRRLTASLEALEARTTSSLSSAEVGGSQDRAEASVSEGQTSPAAPVAKPPERTQEAEPSGVADPADRFYWLFEERMRGSPDSITSKLRAYEGRVAELRAGAGEGEPPLWIDLGCGQGEFGLLLEEWGWRFRGVDASSRAVEACRSRGLHVTQANLIEYLQSYRGEPPLGISAIQVIEHLPKDLWLRLFLEAKRVLRPGGVLLVETINILAPGPLAQSFFADPTHTWPPHPETVRLMASFAGFARAEVIFLNDDPGGNAQDFALWAVTPS